MTPKGKQEIAEGGDSILCESSGSKGEGHAGVIFKKCEDGSKQLLGSTDPVFKTASEAKTAVEGTVQDIRKEFKPAFKKVDEKELGKEE